MKIHAVKYAVLALMLLFSMTTEARETDKKMNVMFDYGLINLPFPSSYGLEANLFLTKGFALGLDYQRSTIPLDFYFFDIGNLSESNLVLQSRLYAGKSFNFLIGMGRRKTSLNLPLSYFDLFTGNDHPVSELQATILRLGVGSKWTYKEKYRIGIDWIHLDIPVATQTNRSASQYADPEDAENVERAEKIMRWYPSGVIAQFKIGIAF